MAKRPVHADQPRAKDIAARLGEAIKERHLAEETLTRVETERIAVIGGRDEARGELKAQIERAGVLEEALHGEYGTNARWQRAYQQATAERDEARGEALLLRQEVARLEALNAVARRRYEELAETCDVAQEAAETYHSAWQDAAVYWKGERDSLRMALANYGQHHEGCFAMPCICGLQRLLEGGE